MTIRIEKIESTAITAVREELKGTLLFLRYSRSGKPGLLSYSATLAKRFRKQGHTIQEESIFSSESLIGNLLRLVRLVRKYRTVHLFLEQCTSKIGCVLPAIILARFFGCRVILSFAGPIDGPLLGRLGSLTGLFLNLCDQITVSSAYHLKLLQEYGVRARQLVQAIEMNSISESDTSSIVPSILVVLPPEGSDNVPAAIRAVELVKQKYPRTSLVILGCGSRKARLDEIASDINRNDAIEIVITQSQKTFFEYLKEADIFLCSSLDNYLPLYLIHALRSGTPVAAVSNEVIKELVTDGVSGLLTERGDHIALAEKLFQLVESKELRCQLAEGGKLAARQLGGEMVNWEWRSLYS